MRFKGAWAFLIKINRFKMYLNCHSFHSLRYGTIPVEELVQMAKEKGIKVLGLTDINASAGVFDFVKACLKNDIKPIVGIEFRVNNKLLYVGLARTFNGFSEMCRFLSEHNITKKPIPECSPDFKEVMVIYPFENSLKSLKKHEFLGVKHQDLNQLIKKENKVNIEKMLLWHPVTFRTKKEFQLHQIMRAVELNTILTKLEKQDYCGQEEFMLPLNELADLYKNHPQLIKNCKRMIASCNFEFDFKTNKNKFYYTRNKQQDKALLNKLALEGMSRRYGDQNLEAKKRVEKEIKVIDDLGFSAYFLITWDIIQYSNSKGFMHIGRGSGANSIVSYCLGITNICPIELNLYFERFLNPSRSSPPDFDIDWSWTDRDTILAYIFERFGYEHVAFCGTTVEFKYRSIIRELGKVFGLPKEELDYLSKNRKSNPELNSISIQVHEYGKMLEKFPNARSMHSCGILISEEPISNYTVLEMLPKGFPTAQFNMHVAEDIGFEKFDILSQRGIGHINDSVRLIEQNQGLKVDIRNIAMSKDEAKCNEMLRQGKTIGCFYIESPAMRGLLRRLNCKNYQTLVAASSVIRPGVAQSGMLREYIFRHNNPDKFEYFHPVFEEQLGDTYGVMVYQEDVIKIAHHFAGIDLTQADILRRAMSGKTRSIKELDGVKHIYFENCRKMGYSDQLSQEVYRQIESFAGYSFCKAHSASYAVESYQSLYLKTYFPIEFMVAVIINEGGFYRTEVYIHEAKMAGAIISCPCVNNSDYFTTVKGKEVFLGFRNLQNLEEKIGKQIAKERTKNGNYHSLEDFINRISIGIENLQILIFIGAFRFTGLTKNELILTAKMILVNFKPENRDLLLIQEPIMEYELPTLDRSPYEDAFDEIELLGFPVSCSPFDLLLTNFRGNYLTNEFLKLENQLVKLVGYLISIKHVPIKSGLMHFGTWIDASGAYFDTTHWPDSLVNFPFQGGGCYLLLGKVDVDFGFPSLVIQKMAKLPFVPDPRYADNKDMANKIQKDWKTDVSSTHRAPYPVDKEIGLPRNKMRV